MLERLKKLGWRGIVIILAVIGAIIFYSFTDSPVAWLPLAMILIVLLLHYFLKLSWNLFMGLLMKREIAEQISFVNDEDDEDEEEEKEEEEEE